MEVCFLCCHSAMAAIPQLRGGGPNGDKGKCALGHRPHLGPLVPPPLPLSVCTPPLPLSVSHCTTPLGKHVSSTLPRGLRMDVRPCELASCRQTVRVQMTPGRTLLSRKIVHQEDILFHSVVHSGRKDSSAACVPAAESCADPHSVTVKYQRQTHHYKSQRTVL